MAKHIAFFFLSLISVTTFSHAQDCNLLVTIENGKICGRQRIDEAGNRYASYRGVPYARQPLGELRFKELQPAEPMEGIFDAFTEGPACPQKDLLYPVAQNITDISESCIHANIHVPLDALPRKYNNCNNPPGLPIMVYVHGGSFYSGSGDSGVYGPEYIVTKNVILITFNYRLNVFGFLSMDTPEIPGNQALRDIVTLLRWVQRNAKAFGGDLSNVTLVGQSAGGVMVHLLTLSTVTADLYSKAMVISGTGLPGVYSPSPIHAQRSVNALLKSLGINANDPKEIHRQLCATPLEDILKAKCAENGPIKATYNLHYEEAGHQDDITFILRMNSRFPEDARKSFPPVARDDHMRDWMTDIFTNFMRCSNPTCKGDTAEEWPALSENNLKYQEIRIPKQYHYIDASPEIKRMIEFFDELYMLSK